LHIFLLPDAIDVATHVERLSSKETNKPAHLSADKGVYLLAQSDTGNPTAFSSGQTQPFAES
jgi:hypothetical protein